MIATQADSRSVRGVRRLILPPNAKDIEFFRTFTKLGRLGFSCQPQTHNPVQSAAEFWKEPWSADRDFSSFPESGA